LHPIHPHFYSTSPSAGRRIYHWRLGSHSLKRRRRISHQRFAGHRRTSDPLPISVKWHPIGLRISSISRGSPRRRPPIRAIGDDEIGAVFVHLYLKVPIHPIDRTRG